ncbi:MAG: hypothetical protein WCY10_04950, partial [Candidatus Omnitrophota bacterium]
EQMARWLKAVDVECPFATRRAIRTKVLWLNGLGARPGDNVRKDFVQLVGSVRMAKYLVDLERIRGYAQAVLSQDGTAAIPAISYIPVSPTKRRRGREVIDNRRKIIDGLIRKESRIQRKIAELQLDPASQDELRSAMLDPLMEIKRNVFRAVTRYLGRRNAAVITDAGHPFITAYTLFLIRDNKATTKFDIDGTVLLTCDGLFELYKRSVGKELYKAGFYGRESLMSEVLSGRVPVSELSRRFETFLRLREDGVDANPAMRVAMASDFRISERVYRLARGQKDSSNEPFTQSQAASIASAADPVESCYRAIMYLETGVSRNAAMKRATSSAQASEDRSSRDGGADTAASLEEKISTIIERGKVPEENTGRGAEWEKAEMFVEYLNKQVDSFNRVLIEHNIKSRVSPQEYVSRFISTESFTGNTPIMRLYFKEERQPNIPDAVKRTYRAFVNRAPENIRPVMNELILRRISELGWDKAIGQWVRNNCGYGGRYRVSDIQDRSIRRNLLKISLRFDNGRIKECMLKGAIDKPDSDLGDEAVFVELQKLLLAADTGDGAFLYRNPPGRDVLVEAVFIGETANKAVSELIKSKDRFLLKQTVMTLAGHLALENILGCNDHGFRNKFIDYDIGGVRNIATFDVEFALLAEKNYAWEIEDTRDGTSEIALAVLLYDFKNVRARTQLFQEIEALYVKQWAAISLRRDEVGKVFEKYLPPQRMASLRQMDKVLDAGPEAFLDKLYQALLVDYRIRGVYRRYLRYLFLEHDDSIPAYLEVSRERGISKKQLFRHAFVSFEPQRLVVERAQRFRGIHSRGVQEIVSQNSAGGTVCINEVYVLIDKLVSGILGPEALASLKKENEEIAAEYDAFKSEMRAWRRDGGVPQYNMLRGEEVFKGLRLSFRGWWRTEIASPRGILNSGLRVFSRARDGGAEDPGIADERFRVLVKRLNCGCGNLSMEAAVELGKSGDPRALRFLIEALKKQEGAGIIRAIVGALLEIGDTSYGPLRAVLQEQTIHYNVRVEIVNALERAGMAKQGDKTDGGNIAQLMGMPFFYEIAMILDPDLDCRPLGVKETLIKAIIADMPVSSFKEDESSSLLMELLCVEHMTNDIRRRLIIALFNRLAFERREKEILPQWFLIYSLEGWEIYVDLLTFEQLKLHKEINAQGLAEIKSETISVQRALEILEAFENAASEGKNARTDGGRESMPGLDEKINLWLGRLNDLGGDVLLARQYIEEMFRDGVDIELISAVVDIESMVLGQKVSGIGKDINTLISRAELDAFRYSPEIEIIYEG